MTKRVAIVTGAARGIGLATTKLLLDEGAVVVMVDWDEEALTAAAKGLENVMPLTADVSDPDAVTQMIAEVEKAHGRIDNLINNAGIADFGPISETDFKRWRAVMAVNLDGVFLCTQAAAPLLKKSKGSIVNIASISGLRASTLRVAYGLSLIHI